MKRIFSRFNRLFKLLGFYPEITLSNLSQISYFIKTYFLFKKSIPGDSQFLFNKLFPILTDRSDKAGKIDPHYLYQDLFVAKEIFDKNPEKHVDIGSRIDGFITHLAVFRKVEVIDIRPAPIDFDNVIYHKFDFMNMPKSFDEYCDSVSSLHAIEHFGLGRYGDPIDFYGHLKALENIYKLLKKNGLFYLSVPMGTLRIEFNAHRVFSLDYLIPLLKEKFVVAKFCYVDDSAKFHKEAQLSDENISNSFNCNWGCAIIVLRKI